MYNWGRAMLTTTLRKVGGSVMMAVPPAILDLLRLEAGATVELAVDGDRLVVERRLRPRYQMEELLAQCDVEATQVRSAEEQEWLEAPAKGREL